MKIRHIIILVMILLLSGCSTVSYYTQSVRGQFNILLQREPIDDVIADSNTPEKLKQALKDIQRIRKFSVEKLHLPDNKSYLYYANIKRPYVVWNVFAAPEFSLTAKKWCYFIVGCVSYRGYFDENEAQEYAQKLKSENYDVSVAGISAYSTLGWFDDPILNTMLNWQKYHLAGLIFHELSHQVLYIKHETAFNEAFSTAVQRIAIIEWLVAEKPDEISQYLARLSAYKDFRQLLKDTRAQLIISYESNLDIPQKRIEKAEIIEQMKKNYAKLKEQWPDKISFDGWFKRPINNSRFTSTMTYLEHIPAFLTIFTQVKGSWPLFYQAVKELSELEENERRKQLTALMGTQTKMTEIVKLIEYNAAR